ncbi:MAG: type III-A CRISPR-associated protein Cas10/Csm1 [Synergistetes bacterium]|nr:type III-A CRISPR-associated protein Cas10/Csm1 [Synergistota bacterium]MDW8192195.1 type III-A CRISPR-associated protein Cas10/Csm1 [Synergistota bacterium]
MNLEVFYLGALFHDVGKFIERTKAYKEISKKEEYKSLDVGRWAHPRYSHFWLKGVCERIPLLKELSSCDVEKMRDLVLWHHKPGDLFWCEVLQTADYLSAAERVEESEEEKEEYNKEPLLSIFSEIFEDKTSDKLFYPLKKLDTDDNIIFPQNKEYLIVNYDELEKDFESVLSLVDSEEDLLTLFERYFWCVPSQVVGARADISLYDHLRTTAAIAVAYWHEIIIREKEGMDYWRDRLSKVRDFLGKGSGSIGEEADFLLIGGDLSGIQSFIFDIPSKGAAKSLKGRSLFLSILMEVIARYIVDSLNLRLVNILYMGGGAFWILAPRSVENRLKDIRKNISKLLLRALKGKIYVALSWVPIYYKNFYVKSEENFVSVVERLQRELSRVKMERFKEVLEDENGYKLLFGSPGILSSYEEHCIICGESEKHLLLAYDEPVGTQRICKMCDSFRELSNRFSEEDLIRFEKVGRDSDVEISDCFSLFKAFGFSVNPVKLKEKERIYFKNSLLKRPKKNNKEPSVKTLEDLAEQSEGDKLLGYIKLDIDSLGRIFKEGLGKEYYSVSRVAMLSRMLAFFFERYIPMRIISNEDYLVFAGGDDAFIISSWSRSLRIAEEIEMSFRKYVAGNRKITFSVGLFLAKPNYPVSRAAILVEEELHSAKSKYKEKDAVCIWGEVFTKCEYRELLKLWNRLKEFFSKKDGFEARGTLFKIIRFSKDLRSMDEEFKLPKPWLFAYALRNVEDKEFKDYIVNLYERLPFKGFCGADESPIEIRNPAILYVASCFAYLSTKEEVR